MQLPVAVRWLSLPLLLLSVAVTRPSYAGLSARLVYLRSGAADACPDQATLKQAVARRLGYDPFLLNAPYTIVAEMSSNGALLRGRARLLDESGIVLGSRELEGKGGDCSELLASLALAISLTLDPMALAAEPDPELASHATKDDSHHRPDGSNERRPPTVAAETATPRERSVTAPRAATPPRESSVTAPAQTNPIIRLALEAGALGALGWVPTFSPAVGLGLVAKRDRWSLGAYGVAVAAQTKTSPEQYRARVSVAYAALSPCYWVGAIGVCALGTLGRYSARGEGVMAPRSGSHLHASAGARLWAMLPLSTDWSLGVHADGVVQLARPEFVVSGLEVFRPRTLAANLGIFAAWRMF